MRTSKKLTALGAYRAGKLSLPPGYHIRLDAEFFTLGRDDDSIVAPFAVGATPAAVVREAEEDYRASGEAAS